MKFTKMQGAGNDYVYIACMQSEEEQLGDLSALAKRVSDRHFGIGSDGLVLILPSEKADFRMRMFNADGTEAQMCGNAARCIGKYVYQKGLTQKTELTLETLAGIKQLLVADEGNRITVGMGTPQFHPDRLVFRNREMPFVNVDMGNPHAVFFTRDPLHLIDLKQWGEPLERHEHFPNRTNVEIVRVEDNKTIGLRVWERGSGETLACGTGACAAVIASHWREYVTTDVTVQLRGGNLQVQIHDDGSVWMSGPAEFVFEGNYELRMMNYENQR